jgi:hypothetical protein
VVSMGAEPGRGGRGCFDSTNKARVLHDA